jgi:phospholipase A1
MKFMISLLAGCWGLFFMQFATAANIDKCLQNQLVTASDSVTIGELKALCDTSTVIRVEPEDDTEKNENLTEVVPAPDEGAVTVESALARRLTFESENNSPFSLIPHKPNYIIISNNLASANEQPFKDAFPDRNVNFQPWETKFQLSLKVPLARGLIYGNGDLFAAYTNRSFWQQFNKAGSSPFRESDHEPEMWLSFKNDMTLFGLHNSVIRTGLVHQSNGQAGTLSRSWNRVYTDFIFEKGNWFFSAKPWWRIPESTKDDNNPDIDDYLGNFEFSGLYKMGNQNFDFMIRNNLSDSDNHGAIQLNYSFPLTKDVKGYVQWFNGYGESLIDYNAYSNSIGVGILLSDWL